MREYPMEWHPGGHPAPTAASNSTKTTTGQTPRTPQICRENTSEQKRCNPQLHTSCDRSSPATATSQQNGSPQYLLTAPWGKKQPRSSASWQSTGILCAKLPSFPESSKSTATAGPTKFRVPAPPPHPLRRSGSRRSRETASPASAHRATIPAMPPLVDPVTAPGPYPSAPESAPATSQSACR